MLSMPVPGSWHTANPALTSVSQPVRSCGPLGGEGACTLMAKAGMMQGSQASGQEEPDLGRRKFLQTQGPSEKGIRRNVGGFEAALPAAEGIRVLGFMKGPQGVAPQGAAGACVGSPACRPLQWQETIPASHLGASIQHNCHIQTNFLKSGHASTFPLETRVLSIKSAACPECVGVWEKDGES